MSTTAPIPGIPDLSHLPRAQRRRLQSAARKVRAVVKPSRPARGSILILESGARFEVAGVSATTVKDHRRNGKKLVVQTAKGEAAIDCRQIKEILPLY